MHKLLVLFCTLFSFISCGDDSKHEKKEHNSPLEEVLERKAFYESRYDRIADHTGFFLSDDCDSLLYNGLYCAGSDFRDITAYRDEKTGQWLTSNFRTPGKQCYADGRSASTISRDMFAGAMWCLWSHGKTKDLQRIVDYGKAHKWVMGEGPLDRTFFTPNFQDTLYSLLGKDYKGLPYTWVDPIKDHQRHVVALNIILRGEKEGKISGDMLDLLENWHAKNPSNALYSYGVARFTDGNQAETINALLNPRLFPADRLPTSADRCGGWLWERSESKWSPCQDKKATHSGGDLVFIAHLLEISQGKSLKLRE